MNAATATGLAVGLAVAAMVGWQVAAVATSDRTAAYLDASEEWCHDRGGELVNVQAVVHGGLHCELPNGSTAHMTDVVNASEVTEA